MDGSQNMEMGFSMTEKNLLTVMAVAEDTEYARMILLGMVTQWATERMISLKLLQINLMEDMIMERNSQIQGMENGMKVNLLQIVMRLALYVMEIKIGMLLSWEIKNGMMEKNLQMQGMENGMKVNLLQIREMVSGIMD